MKVLFDTSVLVAAVVSSHPDHARAHAALRKAIQREVQMVVASHTLAELYAVLTTLPLRPKIHPHDAQRAIRDNVQSCATVSDLSAPDYVATIATLAERGLTGGLIYDALILEAGRKAGIDQVWTLNPDDFHRAAGPSLVIPISVP